MASNLACVGLAVDEQAAFGDLVMQAVQDTAVIGRAGRSSLHRWEDSSGARLVLVTEQSEIVGALPSYDSGAEVNLTAVTAANEDVVTAAVVDGDGEQLTSAAFELEQRLLMPKRPLDKAVCSLTALGRSVSVHADDEAFAASSDSLMSPDTEDDGEPPAHYVEQGWAWPPRMAAESFISYGVFGEAAQAEATARLNGIVVASERKTNRLTGQTFIVARVRSVGFEVDLCMSIDEHPEPPPPGAVVGGEVYLVGSIPTLEPDPTARRSWFRRW